MSSFSDQLSTAQMLPHGVCLSWDPDLIATLAGAEVLLGLAYVSVASTLAIFAIKRRDFPFPWLLVLLAVVFASCGVSHFTDVLTLWFPAYALQATFKAVVALVSVPAAVMMWVLLPAALSLPSPTAIKVAKDAAEHASRAKSTFLATMSHELRTPLNAINGFGDALATRMFGPLNPKQAEYVDAILSSGRHLLNLINDILDLTKIDAGRLTLDEERVDLREVVASCTGLLRGHARAGGVEMVIDLPDDMPLILGDVLRLKQVVLNLLSNAIKFTGRGGIVTVTARCRSGGRFALSVSDTGVGMAAEDVPRAFEMFTQIADPLSRNHSGTGIGLPLSKSLVELHGGCIEVTTAPGCGTCIEVLLPPDRVIVPQAPSWSPPMRER